MILKELALVYTISKFGIFGLCLPRLYDYCSYPVREKG